MKTKPSLRVFLLYVFINPFWLSFFLPAEKSTLIIIKMLMLGKLLLRYIRKMYIKINYSFALVKREVNLF